MEGDKDRAIMEKVAAPALKKRLGTSGKEGAMLLVRV